MKKILVTISIIVLIYAVLFNNTPKGKAQDNGLDDLVKRIERLEAK